MSGPSASRTTTVREWRHPARSSKRTRSAAVRGLTARGSGPLAYARGSVDLGGVGR
jgi:hypothetical protein